MSISPLFTATGDSGDASIGTGGAQAAGEGAEMPSPLPYNPYSPTQDLLFRETARGDFKVPTNDGSAQLEMQGGEYGSMYDFKGNAGEASADIDLNKGSLSIDVASSLVEAAAPPGEAKSADNGIFSQARGNLPDPAAQRHAAPQNGDEPTTDAELLAIGIKSIPMIHTACVDGNFLLVKRVIAAQPSNIEASDVIGSRPLHVASHYGHNDIIRFLIAQGADINAVDNFKSTPLVVTRNPQTVQLLVSHGGDINLTNVNNISAKSMSLEDPYVKLAIDQGLQSLRERVFDTKRALCDVWPRFADTRICRHLAQERNGSPAGPGRKRKRDADTSEDDSAASERNVASRLAGSDAGPHQTASLGSALGSQASSAAPLRACIADLIVSLLYPPVPPPRPRSPPPTEGIQETPLGLALETGKR